jgi:hypothetical protein
LKNAIEETQQRLIPALEVLGAEALAADVPERFRRPPLLGAVGQALVRLSYHKGYHNGQIGLAEADGRKRISDPIALAICLQHLLGVRQ